MEWNRISLPLKLMRLSNIEWYKKREEERDREREREGDREIEIERRWREEKKILK